MKKLREDLPFRRIAVVLAGGGTYGAYEAGALRTLTAAGLQPAFVTGVSVGALNAVAWLAHGGDTGPLESTWRGLRPARLGIRWAMLALRAMGGFLIAIGAIEALLVLAGLPVQTVVERFSSIRQLSGYLRATDAIDFLAWALLGLLGAGLVAVAPWLDDVLSRGRLSAFPQRLDTTLGVVALLGGAVYVLVVALDVPWPLRFHVVMWALAFLAWLSLRSERMRSAFGRLWLRLTPETGGRGLWRNSARRGLIRELVISGKASRLVDGPVQLFVSACDIASGMITLFTNRAPIDDTLGQVREQLLVNIVVLTTPADIVDSAVASSAVPVLYEPFEFRGRRWIDPGLLQNQPLRAVAAAGADAILLVLVSPSAGPRPDSVESNLVEIAGRLSEIANWRDLQAELLHLPAGFAREGAPARVCVVEPAAPLEGGMFEFDAGRTARSIEQGARDAALALERAGWLADSSAGSDRSAARHGS